MGMVRGGDQQLPNPSTLRSPGRPLHGVTVESHKIDPEQGAILFPMSRRSPLWTLAYHRHEYKGCQGSTTLERMREQRDFGYRGTGTVEYPRYRGMYNTVIAAEAGDG
jgi:hypothetical protein